jgi:hypothetical protein
MYNMGKSWIDNLVNGLKSSFSSFNDALKWISDHLPKSPPKTGPLSEVTESGFHSWTSGLARAGASGLNNFNLTGVGVSDTTMANMVSHNAGSIGPITVNVNLDGANISNNVDAREAGVIAGNAAGESLLSRLGKQANALGISTYNYRR